MPRSENTKMSTQFYQSQFAGQPYITDAHPSPQLPAQAQPAPAQPAPAPKKKHVCPTCDRAFTTSGHLARHSRVHTGERNHKCPFPGCETRCSRQDNLQQHYRIHLSPGSRRSSTRSAISRAMGGQKRGSSAAANANVGVVPDSPNAPPPLSSPPALEQARMYTHHTSPPDSPPPLAQATLPPPHLADGSSSRSSSSPEQQYSQYLSMGNSQYSYRSGTTTYQEQSQGSGFTYVHTTPLSHSSPNPSTNALSYSSSSHDTFNNSGSRHSISHITSYNAPANSASSTSPPSPASSHSVSSHASGPPTPTYNVYDDAQARYHSNATMMPPEHGHQIYASSARFDSPPPTLAPIQERRHDCHPQSHASSPYIHQQHQPLPNDYSHAQYPPLSVGRGPWGSESGLRKGVGALIQ
ncbi:hypothetical protein D9756_000004 [Leucocoprinus leucothites]|uniref:C2H2-type domain-containing protein n=1 Tax=Leucocoprinus leucothites TaxID=201217 RepID=A0A8H5GFM4_9AGAR|nr:hypothetical protein D9756_000004 [Leucoagaricus leucothites]